MHYSLSTSTILNLRWDQGWSHWLASSLQTSRASARSLLTLYKRDKYDWIFTEILIAIYKLLYAKHTEGEPSVSNVAPKWWHAKRLWRLDRPEDDLLSMLSQKFISFSNMAKILILIFSAVSLDHSFEICLFYWHFTFLNYLWKLRVERRRRRDGCNRTASIDHPA